MLILAAVVISLIGVKAQQSFSETEEQIIIQEEESTQLYESLVNDFENWYSLSTTEEMMEDEENLNLYNQIFNSLELANQIKEEEIKEQEYDKLYHSLKEDLEIYEVLSIAEIKF